MGDEQDRLLPVANVRRIMKQVLPPTAKISKEAKETMQECATEFVSFVASEAADKCHKENRKTVNGDDICWALSSLGFDDYADAILRYLHKFRGADRQRANQNKDSASGKKDEESNSASGKKDEESDHKNTEPDCQIGTSTLLEFRVLDKVNSSLAEAS